MEATSQAELRALVDKEAIRDCLYRYCRGIDRADEELLRSAYWPDAHDTHGAYVGSANGFIEHALPRLRAGGRGVHQVNNILIELHGDAAAVESSFFALQTNVAAPTLRTLLCGRYLDHFERRQGEWRIAARTVVYDWIEERTRAELAQHNVALFAARQPTGERSPADPVYDLLERVRQRR
ncbi:nuclear transport factor 2 family protein [Piscinibacter sp. XHJ-5]|uniref:nuclear transport factor 2 family protein n=1 Tax=Piscinibacter sp. XHJ-5 TaxID=3037797 RepID=UPI0024529CFC|nr:nuclear transport factor 2 family protein [Piscinibacter sp. XHJ-5]